MAVASRRRGISSVAEVNGSLAAENINSPTFRGLAVSAQYTLAVQRLESTLLP